MDDYSCGVVWWGGGVGEGDDVLLGVSVHNLAFCMFLVVYPILWT
jgi:hypothetical protein